MHKKKVSPNKLSVWKRIRRHLIFCADTCTMHGFSHVVRKNISIYERFLWLAIIIAAISWCIVIGKEAWDHYQNRPTVVSLEKDNWNWKIVFPAVTLCIDIIDEAKTEELSKTLSIPDDDFEDFKSFVTNLATVQFEKNFQNDTFEKFSWYGKSDSYLDWIYETRQTMSFPVEVEQTFGEPLVDVPTITEFGLCFVYNSKISHYNTYEYFHTKSDEATEVNKTLVVDMSIIAPTITIKNLMSGYKIFFHGPYEIPDLSTVGMDVGPSTFANFELGIVSVWTPSVVKDLRITQRKCRFPDESNLKHSPVYSYNLCRIECRIKLCLKLCNCTPFYYKRTGDEKVCTPDGMKCWLQIKHLLTRLVDKNGNSLCSCIQTCDTDNILVNHFETIDWFIGTNVKFNYATYPTIRYKRSLIFSVVNLFVQIGGVASLFLGFSILSLIEIVYFFTIRFYWGVVRGNLIEDT